MTVYSSPTALPTEAGGEETSKGRVAHHPPAGPFACENIAAMKQLKPSARMLVWWVCAILVGLGALIVSIREQLWVVKHGLR